MDSSFCTQCGASLIAGSAFCSNCGALTGKAPRQQVPATVPATAPATVPSPGYAGYGVAAAVPAYAPVAAGVPKPGGFWIRVVAVIIDYIVVQVVAFPAGIIIGILFGAMGAATHNEGAMQGLAGLVGFVFGTGVNWIYEAWMTSSSKQATLGKLALGLQVVDENGQRISFARATGRHFAKYISTLILCIGYMMAGWTDRKRALHDMMAGTYVIYK